MSDQLKSIQWVVQKNLTSEDTFEQIESACLELGVSCQAVTIVPFSDMLPEFDRTKKNIFYGSTTFGLQIMKDDTVRSGMFFNPDEFTMEVYFKHWGQHMLNFGSNVCTVADISTLSYDEDHLLFIRPNDDSKSFSGMTMTFGELRVWIENIDTSGSLQLTRHSKIVIAEPVNIKAEWRLWIVEGKVVAASKYREHFKLKKEAGCPDQVKQFAEQRCNEFTPHDVFVMDIAFCGDEYFIIECGCLNSAGFYAADIFKIVEQVSNYRSLNA